MPPICITDPQFPLRTTISMTHNKQKKNANKLKQKITCFLSISNDMGLLNIDDTVPLMPSDIFFNKNNWCDSHLQNICYKN